MNNLLWGQSTQGIDNSVQREPCHSGDNYTCEYYSWQIYKFNGYKVFLGKVYPGQIWIVTEDKNTNAIITMIDVIMED